MMAKKGFQRGDDDYSRRYTESCTCGVNLPEYPNSVSLILTRDMLPPTFASGWHLSISCVTEDGYRGYVPAEGEYWRRIIFGAYREYAIPQSLAERTRLGIQKDVRHWLIECDWGATQYDPVVVLEGLDTPRRV